MIDIKTIKIGDKVKATEVCGYIEDGLKLGTVGIVVDLYPDYCPYPFVVLFEGHLHNSACSEKELELV